jgi:uncharacterized protein YciI
MFVVMTEYLRPVEEIREQLWEHIDAHTTFTRSQYRNGTFLVGGPKVPETGGIHIARAASRAALEEILKQDPYPGLGLTRYTVLEFNELGGNTLQRVERFLNSPAAPEDAGEHVTPGRWRNQRPK